MSLLEDDCRGEGGRRSGRARRLADRYSMRGGGNRSSRVEGKIPHETTPRRGEDESSEEIRVQCSAFAARRLQSEGRRVSARTWMMIGCGAAVLAMRAYARSPVVRPNGARKQTASSNLHHIIS